MECVYTLFAHKRKSIESLGLGWVTVPPGVAYHALPDGLTPDTWRMLVDVVIRLLGERRRISGVNFRYPPQSFPRVVREYIQKCTGRRQITEVWMEWLREHFLRWSVIADYLLRPENLWFYPARDNDPLWICPQCKTRHLHEALGQCTNCPARRLEQQFLHREVGQEEDYYTLLASPSPDNQPFRLHCEELTGQTDYEDATKRQQLFQGMCLAPEIDRVDTIDLLSGYHDYGSRRGYRGSAGCYDGECATTTFQLSTAGGACRTKRRWPYGSSYGGART
jgi:DEAD/DEAH box helicase domain-containing protein